MRELPESRIGIGFLDPRLMAQLTTPVIGQVPGKAGRRLARVRKALSLPA